MKNLTKIVYLVVWIDSSNDIKTRLLAPRSDFPPDLAGGEVAYKIKVEIQIPDKAEIRELAVPPIVIRQGEISAQLLEIRRQTKTG